MLWYSAGAALVALTLMAAACDDDNPIVEKAEAPGVTNTTVAAAEPSTAAGAGTLVFTTSGSGGRHQAATFTVSATGRYELCWEVSGQEGDVTASVHVYIVPEGRIAGDGAGSVAGQSRTQEQSGCTFMTLLAGRYYVKVIAESFSAWRAALRAA